MRLIKIILSLSCAFILMCTLLSNIKANEEGRYFITISDTIGDFITLESNSLGFGTRTIHILNGKVHLRRIMQEGLPFLCIDCSRQRVR